MWDVKYKLNRFILFKNGWAINRKFVIFFVAEIIKVVEKSLVLKMFS